jgi:hypothetical protein
MEIMLAIYCIGFAYTVGYYRFDGPISVFKSLIWPITWITWFFAWLDPL